MLLPINAKSLLIFWQINLQNKIGKKKKKKNKEKQIST
jgi:hypothetical protein